ncbi:MAG: UDP-N-acetylmuramoyl-tripeptide--D-alanyl-D-alanine ligase [Schwartzia sp.]|nr:UDP-N-acetylmuramoyl-tripeptide--D-alanyl-D-alanine ligase [Schwartzia sp. (in: firmicutes)]
MAQFTTEEVLKATGAVCAHGEDTVFTDVTTDTRKITKGALFVALRGERFNGEDFAAEAAKKGAAGVVVSNACKKEIIDSVPAAVFCVPDTLEAYQKLACAWRMRFDIPVVAITGSNGKTTTKDLTASVIGAAFPVLKTAANFNNEIGLPMTLLNLTEKHRAAVVEIGMRGLGQIAAMAPLAAPTIGVVVNVGETHMELLGSMENIAKAKGEMVEAIKPGGTVVLNADNPYTAAMSGKAAKGVRVITFGIEKDADVRAVDIKTDGLSQSFTAVFEGKKTASIKLPMAGRHNVLNALAALSVGYALNIAPEKMADGLAKPDMTKQRFECEKRGEYTVINDAYNASPASMEAAFATLTEVAPGRKIAVLGDMLELGDIAVEAHRKVGRLAAEAGICALVTRGDMGEEIAAGAEGTGLEDVYRCGTHEEAAAVLKKILKPGDTILFKGSHGMHMDEIIDLL